MNKIKKISSGGQNLTGEGSGVGGEGNWERGEGSGGKGGSGDLVPPVHPSCKVCAIIFFVTRCPYYSQ